MADIDFGSGPDTNSGDTLAQALLKLQNRLAAIGTPTVTLSALTVSNSGATVGAAYSGTIIGRTTGSALSLSGAGAAGMSLSGVTISGTPTTAGAVNVVETLAGATNTPRTTSGLITIASATVTLAALTPSGGFQIGTSTSGTIGGKTSGSTITCNIPGIMVSGGNAYSGTPTGSAATIANGFVETLAGATNSPRSTAVTVAAASSASYLPTVSVAPLSVYSTEKIVSSFSGTAAPVTAGVATSLTDQSGNGFDATPKSGFSGGQIKTANAVRGHQPISTGGYNSNRGYEIPTGHTVNQNNYTHIMIGISPGGTAGSGSNQRATVGAPDPAGCVDMAFDGYRLGVRAHVQGYGAGLNNAAEISVVALQGSSTALKLIIDNVETMSVSANSRTLVGGAIGYGRWDIGVPEQYDFFAQIIYPGALSTAEIATITAWAKSFYGVPANQKRVLFVIDSLTNQAPNNISRVRATGSKMATPIFAVNSSKSGVALGEAYNNLALNDSLMQHAAILSADPANAYDGISMLAGINDIIFGSSASAIWGDGATDSGMLRLIRAYISRTVNLAVGTIKSANQISGANETQRVALNNLIINNATAEGYKVIRYDLDTTATTSDGLHWDDAGIQIVSAREASVLDAIFQAAPSVVLQNLTLSSSTVQEDIAWSATITGKTSGSTITATASDGTVLSVSGTTISGTFANPTSGTPVTITMVEVKSGASNNNRQSIASMTVTAAPTIQYWTPADLGSKLVMWLDADDDSTITLNGTSNVTEWRGKPSINANVTANKATAPTNTGLTYDAASKRINLDGTYMDFPGTGFALGTNPGAMMFLGNHATGGQHGPYMRQGNRFMNYNANGPLGGYRPGDTVNHDVTGALTGGYPYVVMDYEGGPSAPSEIRSGGVVNGTATRTIDATVAGAGTLFLNPGTWSLRGGPCYAVLAINGSLTTDEKQRLEGWGYWKMGAQASLAAGHPYKAAAPTK